MLRRSKIGTNKEKTLYYSYGNRISFYGKAVGNFLIDNPQIWVITKGRGTTYDKLGKAIYTGEFIKKQAQDVLLKNGLYKSYDDNNLYKVTRYLNGKVPLFFI